MCDGKEEEKQKNEDMIIFETKINGFVDKMQSEGAYKNANIFR